MSTTSAVSSAVSSTTSSSTTTNNGVLGQDAFLKLLICQMQNQDPLNPMDNTEYVSQLAQFTSLEQMQEMNSTMEAMNTTYNTTQATGMIGKTVKYTSPDDSSTTLTGIVSGVAFEDGEAKLKIGYDTVGIDEVTQIYASSSDIELGEKSQYALSLIGSTVDYYTISGVLSTGVVDSISFDDGWPTINIGSDSVPLENLVCLHESTSDLETDQAKAIAQAMVGKYVDYINPSDSSSTLTGIPSSVVTNDDGSVQLLIGSKYVDLSDVVKVYSKTD
jgi:flagellar basal-body rod modification protein FlgD